MSHVLSIHILNQLMAIVIIYFQLTAHGVNGGPGKPALEGVVAGIRPLQGPFSDQLKMVATNVSGCPRGTKAAMNSFVHQHKVG